MTVGKLKKLLEGILENLEDYDSEQKLELQGNTYFTRHNSYVLHTPNGFLGLDNLEEAIFEEDDDDCPDCGRAWDHCTCGEAELGKNTRSEK